MKGMTGSENGCCFCGACVADLGVAPGVEFSAGQGTPVAAATATGSPSLASQTLSHRVRVWLARLRVALLASGTPVSTRAA